MGWGLADKTKFCYILIEKIGASLFAAGLIVLSCDSVFGAHPDGAFWTAIQKVETGGCKDPLNAVGDQGRSIGPYQIMRSYYTDAVQQNPSLTNGGRSYENVRGPGSLSYGIEVGNAYMERYATVSRLGRTPTDEDFARIHNGGPNGYKNPATVVYWRKVESRLNNRGKRQTYDTPYIGCANCSDTLPQAHTPCNSGEIGAAVNAVVIVALMAASLFTIM